MTALQQLQNFLKRRKIALFSGAGAGILLAFLINREDYVLGLMIAGFLIGGLFDLWSDKNNKVKGFIENRILFIIALILIIFVGMNLFTPTLLQSVNIPTMAGINLGLLKPLSFGGTGIFGFLSSFLSLGPILIGAGAFMLFPPFTPLGVILIILGAILTIATGGIAIAGIWTILSNFKLILILGSIIILFLILAKGRGKRK